MGTSGRLSDLAAKAAVYLGERGVPNPRLDAELLLGAATGLPRQEILFGAKAPEQEEISLFRSMVERRGRREPLAYILGHREFWSLDLEVDGSVLIPRPETEVLVEQAVRFARRRGLAAPSFIDMGCGCGSISLALVHELPGARVIAVDVSLAAAGCARRNILRHAAAERVVLLCADLFSAFAAGVTADAVVANPPYIDKAAVAGLQPEVAAWEPRLALDGGRRGLEVISRLMEQAAGILRPGGGLLFEAGADQGPDISRMVSESLNWTGHEIIPDYADLPRVHIMEKA